MSMFSTSEQLDELENLLVKYARLPIVEVTIPGGIMEAILAYVHSAEVLRTYDFVDVIDRDRRIGWQIKSTKSTTPVTWKRAKIPEANALIENSRLSKDGLQRLGNAIIEFCNAHAAESLNRYGLSQIAYARLIVYPNGKMTYFERELCDVHQPYIFNPTEFEWSWSLPKQIKSKEQLPALHGTHLSTKKKWWAWHGLGENQLHFSGESSWWPALGSSNSRTFMWPQDSLSMTQFIQMLTPPEM